MKKRLLFVLALLLILPDISLAKPKDLTLKIDGQEVYTDVPPFIKNGRTYVPVRFVTEHLGMKVDYEYSGYDGYNDIRVTMVGEDGTTLVVDGRGIYNEGLSFFRWEDDVPPYEIVNDRTFVPVRFIADALHMDVYWDGDFREIELVTNNNYEEYDLYFHPPYKEYYESPLKSKKFKIIYTGSRYELYPTGMTLDEYMTKNVWKPLERVDYTGPVYEKLSKNEEFLFIHNCFDLIVEQGIVQGYSAD